MNQHQHPPGGQIPVPLLGQQPNKQDQANRALGQAVQQLSLGIYSQAAVAYLATVDAEEFPVDVEQLRQLARDSQTAARAFFEGLGVATFQPDKQDNTKTP